MKEKKKSSSTQKKRLLLQEIRALILPSYSGFDVVVSITAQLEAGALEESVAGAGVKKVTGSWGHCPLEWVNTFSKRPS